MVRSQVLGAVSLSCPTRQTRPLVDLLLSPPQALFHTVLHTCHRTLKVDAKGGESQSMQSSNNMPSEPISVQPGTLSSEQRAAAAVAARAPDTERASQEASRRHESVSRCGT